jgi:hypothetical protein
MVEENRGVMRSVNGRGWDRTRLDGRDGLALGHLEVEQRADDPATVDDAFIVPTGRSSSLPRYSSSPPAPGLIRA